VRADPPPPWRIPSPKADTKNPTPAAPDSVERGRGMFMQTCVVCHGPQGKGDGPAAVALTPKPANLSRPELWQQPDGELFWKITEGRAPMPTFGPALSEQQRWDLINFVRTLSPKPEGFVAPAPAVVAAAPASAPAATPAPAKPAGSAGGTVSREEYDQLKADFEQLKARLAALERSGAVPAASAPAATGTVTATSAPAPSGSPVATVPGVSGVAATAQPGPPIRTDTSAYPQYQQDVSREAGLTNMAFSRGGNAFVFAGDAGVDYIARKGAPNTFQAGFSPLLLWEINDRLFFEAGLDFSLGNDPNGDNAHTTAEMSLANLSYIVNDYITAGGGLFVVPFGIYHSRLDPRWINKLPDDPLPYGDSGIAPNTAVGLFASGGAALGPTKWNYAVYVTNGGTLNTTDPASAGSVSYDNYTDPNGNKAVGGRIGFLPHPGVEIGYSIQGGQVNPNGFQDVTALLQAIDVTYKKELQALQGMVEFRAEWIYSHVSRATYDPTGSLGFGPTNFDNNRQGGYAQISFRPTLLNDNFISNFEPVFRYDWLDTPSAAPGGGNDERFTIGLDYWLTPKTVLKSAYQFDHSSSGPSHDAVLFQFSTGF
jgi:mono/diheme cytochrome c family protein